MHSGAIQLGTGVPGFRGFEHGQRVAHQKQREALRRNETITQRKKVHTTLSLSRSSTRFGVPINFQPAAAQC